MFEGFIKFFCSKQKYISSNENYYSISEILDTFVNNPYNKQCQRIINMNFDLFMKAPGSSHNHQNWSGGYWQHITEVMNIAIKLYSTMNNLRTLPFSLSDALLILFLHDLEKPWKYSLNLNLSKEQNHEFRLNKIKEYDIELNDYQLNALKYVEGENKDYSSSQRIMNPLAAFCHLCDTTSARIWFDEPKNNFGW